MTFATSKKLLLHFPVMDRQGSIWFCKNFSSKLVKDKEKNHNQNYYRYFKSIGINSAYSNTPNLTHCSCITWKTCTSITKRGVALPLRNFYFDPSSIKLSRGFPVISKGFPPRNPIDPPLLSLILLLQTSQKKPSLEIPVLKMNSMSNNWVVSTYTVK